MSSEKTLEAMRSLLSKIGSGQSPEAIAMSFSPKVDWCIPGATHLAPWIGQRKGREEVAAFYRELGDYIEPMSFEISTLLAEYERGVALGQLECRIIKTNKTVKSEFAIEFEVINDLITKYRFYENSYGVAVASQ